MAFVPHVPLSTARGAPPCLSQRARTRAQPAAARRARLPARMLVVEAGSTEEMDRILSAAEGSLVVVDYSTTWCGPCKMIAPVFEEMSDKHTDVVFVKVMGDATPEASDLMRREGIRAVPAFHFWKENKRIKDITGNKSDEIEKSILELKG